ncbi:MAG TPA: hypothetical protein VLL95_02640, partial [Phnomibacter sp.]|nr:hypothetical protein [Phnomibacter sp.]
MKKFILSILTFLYIFGTTGTTLSAHYCMGRLADWSIGHSKEDTCGRCGMEKSGDRDNGCCSDEETFVKNTADQKPGSYPCAPLQPPAEHQAYYPVHCEPSMMACGSIVF